MEKVKISSTHECAEFLRAYGKRKKECMGVVCLDADYSVISKKIIAEGNDHECRFHVRFVFFEACRKKSRAVILFHNHPDGDASPSKEDIDATETIMKGSEYVGIQCLDHIILAKDGYFSFLENDMMGSGEKKNAKVERVSRTQEVFS